MPYIVVSTFTNLSCYVQIGCNYGAILKYRKMKGSKMKGSNTKLSKNQRIEKSKDRKWLVFNLLNFLKFKDSKLFFGVSYLGDIYPILKE